MPEIRDEVVEVRDNEQYKSVRIPKRIWLAEVEKVLSKNHEGQWGMQRKWTLIFKIMEPGEFLNATVPGSLFLGLDEKTNQPFVTPKRDAYQWLQVILNQPKITSLNKEELIGKPVRILVDNKAREDGTWSNFVTQVLELEDGSGSVPAAKPTTKTQTAPAGKTQSAQTTKPAATKTNAAKPAQEVGGDEIEETDLENSVDDIDENDF